MNRYTLTAAVFFLLSCSEGDTVNNYYITPESSTATASSSSIASSSGNASSSSSAQAVSSSGTSSSTAQSSSGVSSSSGISSSSVNVSSSSTALYSSSSTASGDFITDARDGIKYKITKIGTQTWMAENLRYKTKSYYEACYGKDATGVTSDSLAKNCDTYGMLYDWSTALISDEYCNSRLCNPTVGFKYNGICPEGWHLPEVDEWLTLFDFVGDKTLLRANSSLYGDRGLDNPDPFGFSALPGGYRGSDGFVGLGNYGVFWSATESDKLNAYGFSIGYTTSNNGIGGISTQRKINSSSIRCVKD